MADADAFNIKLTRLHKSSRVRSESVFDTGIYAHAVIARLRLFFIDLKEVIRTFIRRPMSNVLLDRNEVARRSSSQINEYEEKCVQHFAI